MTEEQLDIIEQSLDNMFLAGIFDEDSALILMTKEGVVTFWHPDGIDPEESEVPNVKAAIKVLIDNGVISKRKLFD